MEENLSREEILSRSRRENRKGDERERTIRMEGESFSLLFVFLMGLVLLFWKRTHGLPDADVQKQINDAIRNFFLKGPSVTAEYDALEGGYGASLEGSVLVVWASCISGKGAGASVWNNSLAFDVNTGEQYQMSDLFVSGYMDTVRSLLPDTHEVYLYSFPRMSTEGVTWYYNEYESELQSAYTESYLLTFDQLADVIDESSDCYIALQTPYQRPASDAVAGFADVSRSHWAASFIETVAGEGLMQGADGKFRPDETITAAEVCATIARVRALPEAETVMEGIDPAAWYAGEVSATEAAGLLEGLTDGFQPEAAITRADTMQIFANLLVEQGSTLPDAAAADAALFSYADAADIPAARRQAIALCLESGLIEGYADGTIKPQNTITRSEYAKLLTSLI